MFGVYNIERYGKGNDLKLTIDSEICNVAYEALNGRKGTVGVVNYKTGDIICSVSSPSYDVNDVPSDLETNSNYEGAYINRLLSAHYTPGSTFKLVTAICAIENIDDIDSRTWDCNGKFTPETGSDIICNSNHGKNISFKDALAQSCNSVFAQIAIELGEDKLNATVKELGIGSSVTISGVISSYSGNFSLSNASDDLLGWTGIGQGKTQIAPITMLRIVSAIANGGSVSSFNVVNSLANQAGNALNITLPNNQVQLLSSEVASQIKTMMRYNVKTNYGESNYKGLNLCAKSGTAQIDNDSSHDTTWFVGFMDDEDYPYAFVVVVENGVSGASTAGPVANKVLQAIKNKY
jgi:peptidoglycan glycosyltransferase